MEKPVEIVEKCEFSTATPANSNSGAEENRTTAEVDKAGKRKIMKIMLPRTQMPYWQKKGEKVIKKTNTPHVNPVIQGVLKKSL